MSTAKFDAFTRRATAGVSRRRSFLTLGGAGLAAAFGAPLAAAKKSGKKQAKKKCQQQVGQCRSWLTGKGCSEATCPEFFACCDFLGTCNAGEFVACLGAVEV